jgi:hypothetical protein
MDNLIVFVHTCTKYEETRAKIIENTWGKNKPNVIFITDNPSSSLKNHIYLGPYIHPGPTYHPITVIKIFHVFMNKYKDKKWFMVIDDDSYLYTDKLVEYIQFLDETKSCMIGDFLNWTEYHSDWAKPNYQFWVGGGPGILFSKKAIQEYNNICKGVKIPFENHDVWLHRLYQKTKETNKIQRIHCQGFHQFGGKDLLTKYGGINSKLIISVHLNHNMDQIYDFHFVGSEPTTVVSLEPSPSPSPSP